MNESRYCSLCGCICVACAQLEDGYSSCELLHPKLIQEEVSGDA